MVLTNFNGAGVGFGFGVGCGFGIGWGFGGMPLSFAGLGAGGGCGVGLGLGWGIGAAFGSQYRSSQVLNVTGFLEEHPGGDMVILDVAGKDVTKEFQAARHSKADWNLQLKYQVAPLGVPLSRRMTRGSKPLQTFKETRKQMSAVMVKDDSTRKYAPFLELFVPLLVAGSYFCYRFITAVN